MTDRSHSPAPARAARAALGRAATLAAALAATLATTGCNRTAAANATPPVSDAALMDRGLNFLYKAGMPDSAVAVFQQVLAHTPTHYGAHFQLAKALDAAGRPEAARTWWLKVKPIAEGISDTVTLKTVNYRLAAPDTVSQTALMTRGLGLLYQGNDPAGAAAQFRQVLQRNPEHYGAHFQLAKALDASGQAADGRKEWEQVLRMATQIKDQVTADTARGRLRPVR